MMLVQHILFLFLHSWAKGRQEGGYFVRISLAEAAGSHAAWSSQETSRAKAPIERNSHSRNLAIAIGADAPNGVSPRGAPLAYITLPSSFIISNLAYWLRMGIYYPQVVVGSNPISTFVLPLGRALRAAFSVRR